MKKSEMLYIRLTPELKKQIEKDSKKENRSMSNYVSNIILKYYKEEK